MNVNARKFCIRSCLYLLMLLVFTRGAFAVDRSVAWWTGFDGQQYSLSQAQREGKTVALVFWQSWCPNCKHELPRLEQVAKQYAAKLQLFGVISGSDGEVENAKARQVINSLQLSYPQLSDPEAVLAGTYAVRGTPTIVVLGPDGDVVYRGATAPSDWTRFFPERYPLRSRLQRTTSPVDGELLLRERKAVVMGTDIIVKALGTNEKQLDEALIGAIAELQRIDDLMTDWRPSPLTELNDAAGQGPKEVPRELAAIIARAIEIGRLTDGAFDISYAAVGALWDFKRIPPEVPDAQAVAEALRYVGSERIKVDPEKNTVTLPKGMRIGLGGIAKGYGVDRAMKVLIDRGVQHASVSAGGDMKLLGRKFGKAWEVAVKHPRESEYALAVLQVSNSCVVTSGDYERYFEKDGRRYHHIIDPRNGYPAEGAFSTTLVAQNAEYADALATGISVLGVKKGMQLVESLPKVEAIIVGSDGSVHASRGLQGAVQQKQLNGDK